MYASKPSLEIYNFSQPVCIGIFLFLREKKKYVAGKQATLFPLVVYNVNTYAKYISYSN